MSIRTNAQIAEEALKRARRMLFLRQNRQHLVLVSLSALACLGLIAMVAMGIAPATGAMPGRPVASGTLGALFLYNEAIGYVVIGVLSFLLGVAVSLIAFLLRKRSLSQGSRNDLA